MEILINYWAVLGSAGAMMVIGALWYGPIFGRVWMKLMGYDKERMRNMKMTPAKSMSLMFIAALIISYVLALFFGFTGVETAGEAVLVAFLAWLGFIATSFASLVFFEERSVKVYLINVLYYLVALVAAAIILAHWA